MKSVSVRFLKCFSDSVVLVFSLLFLTSALTQAEEAEPKEEAVSLFDGETLAGWDSTPNVWRVEEGAITAGSHEKDFPRNEFIFTQKSYANFDLTLKIKCSGDLETGQVNSGIQIRSARLKDGSAAGYQIDCGKGWFGKIYDEHRRRLLYDTPLNEKELLEAIDTFGWNDYRILAEGPRIQVWINGIKASDYTETNPDIPLNGHIAPQIHKGGHVMVQFKDVLIRELPETADAPTWESLGGAQAALAKVKPKKKPRPKKGPQGKPKATPPLPVTSGLLLDLNANLGVETEDGNRVKAWSNQVKGNGADVFVKQDEGRKKKGSGRPGLRRNVPAIGGHSALVFAEQELVNHEEDVFDHLVNGSGYTWFSVMSVAKQRVGKKDVNSFFGNLRNGPPYDGFWGNLMDDNRVWMGTRNGIAFPVAENGKRPKAKLWDEKLNPCVATAEPLEVNRYYLIMGRMGAGEEVVDLELFVNSTTPVDKKPVPVNPEANPSKMAVGQERDAVNHPGKESFHGQIARFLIFDRPLSDEELVEVSQSLKKLYQLKE